MMFFEYTDTFYLDERDLEEMVELCKDKGYTPQEALDEVSEGWDDVIFYAVGHVEDKILEEIQKRL